MPPDAVTNLKRSICQKTDGAYSMKDHKLTVVGLLLGISLYVIVRWTDTDLFEIVVEAMQGIERFEVDELILPGLVIFVFSYYDHLLKARRRMVEIERQKTFRAMMESMQHILNNFLNQLGLFRLTAEETPEFDPAVLQLFDQVIDQTSDQIKTLGEISSFDEETIIETIRPK